MSSPQIPDAPIEPQDVADLSTGSTRIAAAGAPGRQVHLIRKCISIKVAVLIHLHSIMEDYFQHLRKELLVSLHKEQRCRHLNALAEEKAPLRDWLQGLRLLQCYRSAIATYMVPHPLRKRRRNELTENGSHPSNADFTGAEQCIKEGKGKISAAWVAATAAPHHATGNRDLLSGFIMKHDDQFVHAVDGIPRKVLARGAVITDTVVIPDVWFVPGLTENLVSVSQLVDLDHSVGFSCGACCVRSTDGKVVGKGHLQEGGLYVLDFLKVPLAI